MTSVPPPRVAVYLLHRFLPDNEPLVGDLLEEFERRRSRAWFWKQAVSAIVLSRLRQPAEIRPLRLVDERLTPLAVVGQSRLRPIVNLTAGRVHGTGGLGIVSLLVLSTALEPGMWWLVVFGIAAGIAMGGFRVIRARRRGIAVAKSPNHIFTGR
jgi:hypothetical protein